MDKNLIFVIEEWEENIFLCNKNTPGVFFTFSNRFTFKKDLYISINIRDVFYIYIGTNLFYGGPQQWNRKNLKFDKSLLVRCVGILRRILLRASSPDLRIWSRDRSSSMWILGKSSYGGMGGNMSTSSFSSRAKLWRTAVATIAFCALRWG